MADPERLELPTPAFEAQCSIQLSYGSDFNPSRLLLYCSAGELNLSADENETVGRLVPEIKLCLRGSSQNRGCEAR